MLGINAVILGLVFLFIEPNPNDPLNHDAAEYMRNNYSGFVSKVKSTLRGGTFEGLAFPRFV